MAEDEQFFTGLNVSDDVCRKKEFLPLLQNIARNLLRLLTF